MANTSKHSNGNTAKPGRLEPPPPPPPDGPGKPGEPVTPTTFSRELLVALLRFKDGDFTSRLPADLGGIEGKIADVFNDILAVSARRTAETSRVCRVVGKEGKLKERMRVPGAVGGWADEITALNTLIDDLVWPTTEVTRAVGAVAKGDLSQAMALDVDGRPLEGEFLRSAQLVNKMID
ncbi:MAG TPA: HAMP domain-containing protein, partial [Polyangia bacterium]